MSNILGPAVGYTDLLDLAITEKLEAKAQEERGGKFKYHPLRPSSAGYCGRRLAYALNEYRGNAYYEKPLSEPASYRLLDLGHSIETNILRHFQLLKVFEQRYRQQVLTFFELTTAQKIKREIVEGSCDFVFWSEKYKAIGDVKSKKDKFSIAYRTNWDEELDRFANMASLTMLSETAFYADNLEEFIDELGDDFLVDNLYQLNLYACADFMVERGVDHAFLYRYNKNDSRHMEIRFRPSKALFDKVKEKYNRINLAIEKKSPELVERDFVFGSSRCGFCPYKAECYPDEDALRAYFGNLPKKPWPAKVQAFPHLAVPFEQYESGAKAVKDHEALEKEILKTLANEGIDRIQLDNKHVYEVKHLKSPRPHLELRRAKL